MVLYIGTGAAPLRGSFLLAGLVLFWGLGFWQGKKRGFDALTLVLASVLTPLLSVFCAHFFYRLVNLAYARLYGAFRPVAERAHAVRRTDW